MLIYFTDLKYLLYKLRRAKLDRWSLDVKVSVSAQLSSLKFVFKMNFVHICLLNVKLRPRRVRIVVAYVLYTPTYGMRIALCTVCTFSLRNGLFHHFWTYWAVYAHLLCAWLGFMDSFGNKPRQVSYTQIYVLLIVVLYKVAFYMIPSVTMLLWAGQQYWVVCAWRKACVSCLPKWF